MKTKLFTELDLMLFADGGGEGGGNAGTGAPEGGSTPAKASKNPLGRLNDFIRKKILRVKF